MTLDADALIAFENRGRQIGVLMQRARDLGAAVYIPAGVLAQVWLDGSRQARLAALLSDRRVRVEDLSAAQAKAVGELCGRRGTSDVIDASVVVVARKYGSFVATGDAADILQLDPKLDVAPV